MTYFILLIAEVLSLFVLSRFLSRALSELIYRLTHSHKIVIYSLAALFLPGTVIHEAAHVLVANLLLVPTGKVEFLPVSEGEVVKLGSAEVAQTDFIRRALIGFAPVLVGVMLLIITLYFLSQSSASLSFWVNLLLLIGLFEVSNTMFSSKKDLEGTVEVVALIIAIIIGLFFLKIYQPFFFLASIINSLSPEFFKKADLFILIPIVIDVIIIGATRLLILKKR